MEEKEYEGNEDENTAPEENENDDDSITDKCWAATYKGDSRKWIIRDASYKMKREPQMSCMKDCFRYPVDYNKKFDHTGRKRSLLMKKFYEEAAKEIEEERGKSMEKGDYCTEYDGNFNVPGFKVDQDYFTNSPELYEKYPLYGAQPTTYYSFNLKNQQPRGVLGGLTTTVDVLSPFKKCAKFTTPLNEKLDDKIY